MIELNFLFDKKILARLKQKQHLNYSVLLRKQADFPIYVLDRKFENPIEFLLVTDKNKSHYVDIKYFDRFIFHKTKQNKKKKNFSKSCLQCLVVKMC